MNTFHSASTCTTKFSSAHEIKGFYKGYFRPKKGCFTDNLTKIKSKLALHFLAFLRDPSRKNLAMTDRCWYGRGTANP